MTLYLHKDGVVLSEHGCGLRNGMLAQNNADLGAFHHLY